MRKLYFIMAFAIAALTANAQQTLNLSTTNGSNLQKYDGQVCKVNANRYVFNGWNTISLPFALSENELNEVFGNDCRLEKLVAVEQSGTAVSLFFQDCKAGGIEANVPYILYYTGENGSKRISKETIVSMGEAVVAFHAGSEYVQMAAAQKACKGTGLYGILAADNSEAKFVAVDEAKGGFHATRCFVKLDSGNNTTLTTYHLAAGATTSISAIAAANGKVDVYNVSGVKVASGINAEQVQRLQPGVYVVNGQKVLVK